MSEEFILLLPRQWLFRKFHLNCIFHRKFNAAEAVEIECRAREQLVAHVQGDVFHTDETVLQLVRATVGDL